jgi:hypothetical protein
MSSNGNLKYITTCKLCGQRFANKALPIIGDNPDASTRSFIHALILHLNREHPQQFQAFTRAMVTLANNFAGWLALQNFEITDPNLLKSQEELRTFAHSITRKNDLTDAEITDKIVSLEPLTAEKVTALCKEWRDFLTEQGRYQTPAVTV